MPKSNARKTENDLTEEERLSVSALSTLASGLIPVWRATAYERATDAINKLESAIKGHGI
ncbi:VENN motif pre-toxin domain-containing protein [Pectobacterium polaris]|uniref:VENN motif pre-toxin domain-containing protein n=1 Tax=Pectobacterium polaris TaxID=2042057 RepID=UPI000F73E8E5